MKSANKIISCMIFLLLFYFSGCSQTGSSGSFKSDWSNSNDRIWAGPDYWANRLQDWRIDGGRLECTNGARNKPMRTVHLLTRRLMGVEGSLEMFVKTGLIDTNDFSNDAAVGFLIGAGKDLDYRAASLIHSSYGPGAGLFAGINGEGKIFIRDFSEENKILAESQTDIRTFDKILIRLKIRNDPGTCIIYLSFTDPDSNTKIGELESGNMEYEKIRGNLALVSHPGSGCSRFWFENWNISGGMLEKYEDRNCGPILSTQYTLNDRILKLTAQMMPIGKEDNHEVFLQIRKNGIWETVDGTKVIDEGYVAPFRVENWDENNETKYRVLYILDSSENSEYFYYEGSIRKNPIGNNEFTIAAFTGNHNVVRSVERANFPWYEGVWFPHNDIVTHVKKQEPDFLFFSGDQVYEGASPTAADLNNPWLDYLYKWYLWCWAFRDLTRSIPAVTIPDDHDVFHGNVWGAGGKPTKEGVTGAEAQDSGGYKLPPDWVNMVQRTQTSHLPDPFDQTPVQQGIGVYYCDINYGGVSFAVIEDRKFKSAPKTLLPSAEIWNGWAQNRNFNPKRSADAQGAELLGDRQLKFLENWASDWSNGIWMKVLLSQTIFANVATLPEGSLSGSVIPGLPILKPGEYAENDVPVADMDSNGWPQTGRNKAVRAIRKGFAIHIAGDQHLGSTIRYGVEKWNDSGFALCVPSVANFWPRRWYPSVPDANRAEDSPKYTGEFEDGFGNKMTVYAVSNPTVTDKHPSGLHDRAPGYGMVRLYKDTREIIFENWPRWSDPETGRPYEGWPVVTAQEDNYRGDYAEFLPTYIIDGLQDPVFQIIDIEREEIVYTLRISGTVFRPRVFRDGNYKVIIGEPGTGRIRTYDNVQSMSGNVDDPVIVRF
ncbi:alkaline phosphatase D family protein [candidate division KSB1 bacterium]